MFNNNQEQLSSSKQFSLFTGLAVLQVLAINPDQQQLANIIGEEAAQKFNLDYSVGQYGRPITFWLKSPDNKVSAFQKTIFLKDEPVPESQNTGKALILNNSTGQYGVVQSTWATGPEDCPQWFSTDGVRAARKGELDWYDTVVKLLRFRDKSDGSGVSYVQFLKDEGLDFDSLVNSTDDSVLHNFVEWLGDNGKDVFVALLTVRESNSGKHYQDCELGSCMFGNKSITDATKARIEKINTPEYPVSKNIFTIELKEYSPGTAKDEPAEVATKATPKKSWI